MPVHLALATTLVAQKAQMETGIISMIDRFQRVVQPRQRERAHSLHTSYTTSVMTHEGSILKYIVHFAKQRATGLYYSFLGV